MQRRKYAIPVTVNNTEFEAELRNSHCDHYFPQFAPDLIAGMIYAAKY
jgi:hypothetical protein